MCELKIKILEACLSFGFSFFASGNGVFFHPTPDSKTYSIFNRCRELAWTFEPFDSQRGRLARHIRLWLTSLGFHVRASNGHSGFTEFGCLFLWLEND